MKRYRKGCEFNKGRIRGATRRRRRVAALSEGGILRYNVSQQLCELIDHTKALQLLACDVVRTVRRHSSRSSCETFMFVPDDAVDASNIHNTASSWHYKIITLPILRQRLGKDHYARCPPSNIIFSYYNLFRIVSQQKWLSTNRLMEKKYGGLDLEPVT